MRDRPLLVRLCEVFVDNLALILRAALVLGAIAFVQELRDVREYFLPGGVDESMTAGPGSDEEPADMKSRAEDEPWLTDGVRHALNCTHTEYRNRHYDECVKEPSDVYRKPGSGADDDIGFIARDDQVLYARLEPVTD